MQTLPGSGAFGNGADAEGVLIATALGTTEQAKTATATTTIDWDSGSTVDLDLDTNITTLNLSNPTGGATYKLIITQNSGGETIAWPAAVKWAGGAAPTLSTGAGDIDVVCMFYNTADSSYYASAELDFG